MVIHDLQQKDGKGEVDGHDLHFILGRRATLLYDGKWTDLVCRVRWMARHSCKKIKCKGATCKLCIVDEHCVVICLCSIGIKIYAPTVAVTNAMFRTPTVQTLYPTTI
jgi:hypothetical protein